MAQFLKSLYKNVFCLLTLLEKGSKPLNLDRKPTKFFYQKILKFRRFFGFPLSNVWDFDPFSDNLSKIKYYNINFLKIGQKLDNL